MTRVGPAFVVALLLMPLPVSAQDATVPADAPDATVDAADTGTRLSSRQRALTRPALTLGVNFSGGTNGKNGDSDPGGPSGLSHAATGAEVLTDLGGDLKYYALERPIGLVLTAQSAARKYSTLKKAMILGSTVGGAASWPLGRFSLQAAANYAYQPTYTLAPAAGVGMLPPPPEGELVLDETSGALTADVLEFGVAKQPSHRRSGTAALTYSMSRRMRVALDGSRARAVFPNARDRDSDEWSGAMRWTYDIFRGVGVKIGYGRRVAQLDAREEPNVLEDLDIGLDTQRGFSLTLSKSTRLDLTTGTSMLRGERSGYKLNATADVALTHFIGRSANAGLRYTRGGQFMEGFVRPVFTDTFGLGGGGRIGERIQYGAQAAMATGYVGDPSRGNAYNTYNGTLRASWSATRWANGYLQYLVYQHDIGDDVVMMPGAPREAMRQTVRFGVTFDFTLLSVGASTPPR